MAEETTKVQEQPTLETINTSEGNKGAFYGVFLAPLNHLQAITNFLTEESKKDEELAKAIADGKKTIKGCNRFILNNMKDLMREMKAQELQFDEESVHKIAVWYMKNNDVEDVQNAVKEIVKSNGKSNDKSSSDDKSKGEKKKPKGESKKTDTKKTGNEKKGAKVVPLTPQIGSLFTDDMF